MNVFENIPLGSMVNFETYVSSVIPNQYLNVKMVGLIDFDTAKQWIDPIQVHENVFPHLPEGSLDSPQDYYYLKVLLENGKVDVVGMPWIRTDTVVKLGVGTLTLVLEGRSVEELPAILKALNSNGFNVSKSTIV